MGTNEEKKLKMKSYVFFIIFVVLIIGGIVTKRVFGHPEFMMIWHLPAAVFLVLAGMNITKSKQSKKLMELERLVSSIGGVDK